MIFPNPPGQRTSYRFVYAASSRLSTQFQTIDSRQPVVAGPSGIGLGNVPALTHRHSVVRLMPRMATTSLGRSIRSRKNAGIAI